MVDKRDDKHGVFDVFFGLSDSAQDLEDVCDYRLATLAGLEEDPEPLDTVALQARPVEAGEVLVQRDHDAEGRRFEVWPFGAAEPEDESADAMLWAQPFGAFLETAPAHEPLVAPMPSVRTQGHAQAHQSHMWHVASALVERAGAPRDEAYVSGLSEVLEVAGVHGQTLLQLEAVLSELEPSTDELLLAAHVREHWGELGDQRQVPKWAAVTMLVMCVNMHDLDELLLFIDALFGCWAELRVHVDQHMALHLSEHEPDELPSLFIWDFVMESLRTPTPDAWHLIEHVRRPARVHDAHRFSRRPDLHSGGWRAVTASHRW